MKGQILSIFILCLTTSTVLTIVIEVPQGAYKKCYFSQHSADKTLQVRLGFPRKGRTQCLVRLTVEVLYEDSQATAQVIYQGDHRCQQMRTNEPYVVKHTSQDDQFLGKYRVCIEFLSNSEHGLKTELHIGQKLNPVVFHQDGIAGPLVQSTQLMDLDMTVQSIKKSLSKSREHASESRREGDLLDVNLESMMSMYKIATIMQVVALVAFGALWIRLVSRLKRD